MTDVAAITPAGGDVYDPAAMMADVRHGLWSELDAPSVKIDAFRPESEREHLAALDALLNPEIPPKQDKQDDGVAAAEVPAVRPNETDSRALARGELVAIRDAARGALPKAAERITRVHLQETMAEVEPESGREAVISGMLAAGLVLVRPETSAANARIWFYSCWLRRSLHMALMKRIAIALVALSSVASAQGRPFSFTVPFPDGTPQLVLRYDGGVSNGTFEPLSGDHIQQTGEMDMPLGSRALLMASGGYTFGGPTEGHAQTENRVTQRTMEQAEVLLDVLGDFRVGDLAAGAVVRDTTSTGPYWR